MDQLTGPLDEVFEELRKQWKDLFGDRDENVYTVLMGFIKAVDWQEPFIISLLVFHVALLLGVLVLRRSAMVQLAIFLLCMPLVFLGEHLNGFAAAHWDRFVGQNYFDKRGVFYSAMISGPILVLLLIQLINLLREMMSLMIQVKRKELRYKARMRAQEEKEAKKDN